MKSAEVPFITGCDFNHRFSYPSNKSHQNAYFNLCCHWMQCCHCNLQWKWQNLITRWFKRSSFDLNGKQSDWSAKMTMFYKPKAIMYFFFVIAKMKISDANQIKLKCQVAAIDCKLRQNGNWGKVENSTTGDDRHCNHHLLSKSSQQLRC